MPKNKQAQVFHFDLQGKREFKYEFLNENSLASIAWNELKPYEPNFFLVKKDNTGSEEYELGFKVDDVFNKYNNGIETGKDSFFYDLSEKILIETLAFAFQNKGSSINKFEITNTDNFKFLDKFNSTAFNKDKITKVSYRPFDIVSSYYDVKLQRRPAFDTMRHMLQSNLGLLTPRQVTDSFSHIFISKYPTDCNLTGTAKKFGSAPIFPLYLYPESNSQDLFASTQRTPNLNPEIVKQIADKIGLVFTPEKKAPLLAKEGLGVVEKQEKHHINNLPHLKTFRRELRNNLTPAEAKFWTLVQNSKLEGRKFRRQHSVGNYILDFYCPSEKLAIELDGQVHFNEEAQERDHERTLFLNYYGIKVLRFENKLVFNQTESVLEEIKASFGWTTTPVPPLEGVIKPPPAPPLEGGELFAPIDILDYIYAVLHSPNYREKYKEFLKIDFPRVPYPKDKDTFWQLVNLGSQIRQIHLLESPTVEKYITQYPINGNNEVGKIRFAIVQGERTGKVYINDTQYFDNVPQIAWDFYIGGYQPAQKWLKDRKERTLEFDDILHYQKIIVALSETDKLMKEIDKIGISQKHGAVIMGK